MDLGNSEISDMLMVQFVINYTPQQQPDYIDCKLNNLFLETHKCLLNFQN